MGNGRSPLQTEAVSPQPSRSSFPARLPQRIQHDLELLRRAWRHPRLPWHVRLLCGLLLAYALSPMDLIPDVIPILGHLDDLLILPLGLALCLYLLTEELKEE